MASRRWEARAAQLLEAGKCQEATDQLVADPHEDASNWYQLLAFAALDCYDKGGGTGALDTAISYLDSGMRRRPRSAVLVQFKATLLRAKGDIPAAQALFIEARRIAETNIAEASSPDGLHVDRRVLDSTKRLSADH